MSRSLRFEYEYRVAFASSDLAHTYIPHRHFVLHTDSLSLHHHPHTTPLPVSSSRLIPPQYALLASSDKHKHNHMFPLSVFSLLGLSVGFRWRSFSVRVLGHWRRSVFWVIGVVQRSRFGILASLGLA